MKSKERILLLLANTFLWMTIGLYLPFLSAYLLLQGLTAQEVGLIVALFPFMSLIAVPFWGKISDKTENSKKVIMFACLGVATSIWLFYLAANFFQYFLCASLTSLFLAALTPLLDSLILSICNVKGMNFSLFRIGGTIGYATIVLIYGFVLNQFPKLQFVSMSVLSLLLLLTVIQITVPEKKSISVQPKKGRLFTSNQVYFVIFVSTLSMFGVNYIGNFLGIILIEAKISRSMIGVLNFASAFSEIPILLTIDSILKRMDTRKILVFSTITLVVRLLLLSTGNILFMLLSQILQSTSYMLVYYSSIHFVMHHTFSGKEAQGNSLLFSIQNGAGSIFSSLIGGWLIEAFNARVGTIILAAAVFVILIISVLVKKGRTNTFTRRNT